MTEVTSGVLEVLQQGYGFLRDPENSFQAGNNDVWVSPDLIRQHGLVNGATVSGAVQQASKGPQLATVESICGLTPEQFQQRTRFDRLTAISPNERFPLGKSGDASMRAIELIAPIGKGTRGLVVAPPKAGKTQILSGLASAIHAAEPEKTRIIALLIDERPEEVTHFRRHVPGEVLASSSDQPLQSHTQLAELTMDHIRCELECGRDVVVLVDSITRLVRAFNLRGGSGRTLSGGVDASALEIPRRFFGLARNVENGGSVTVVATALIETGSRMDDYVFEEFKSTGNMEIVLDRSLAEARIFPAINVHASGTRNEDLLYSDEEMQGLTALRRWLAKGTPKAAMVGLLKLLEQTDNNEELLARLPKA